MFNLMKKNYRNTNCYTPKQLLEFVQKSNEDVELVDVMNGGGGFKNWDKFQNKYMRAPESIQAYHVFMVDQQDPNRLMCQEADKYPIVYDDNIIKKPFRDQPWTNNLQEELEDIEPVGLKDIKWITLYDEWRPFVPVDLRKDYEYFHNDPGTERREKTKLNRGEAAETRKKRAITTDNEPNKRKPSKGKKVAVAAKKAKRSAKPAAKKPPAKKKPASTRTNKNADADKKPAAKKRGPFQFGKL
jgi:hypothetical protein